MHGIVHLNKNGSYHFSVLDLQGRVMDSNRQNNMLTIFLILYKIISYVFCYFLNTQKEISVASQ